MKTKTLPSILACVAIAVFTTSCGSKDKGESNTSGNGTNTGPTAGAGIPGTIAAAVAPEGALSVVAARAAAKPRLDMAGTGSTSATGSGRSRRAAPGVSSMSWLA